MIELKPCKICKDCRDIEMISSDDSMCIEGILDIRRRFRVRCKFCGTVTDWHDDPYSAVQQWNRGVE